MALPGGTTLQSLAESGLTVADAGADVRGRKVIDPDGDELGEVDDLLIDDRERRVRMLRVKHGGFLGIGADHFLVPVDAVRSVSAEAVHIDRQRSRLTDAPGYDPPVTDEVAYFGDVYAWWAYPPYWSDGYTYPGYPFYPYP